METLEQSKETKGTCGKTPQRFHNEQPTATDVIAEPLKADTIAGLRRSASPRLDGFQWLWETSQDSETTP